MSWRFTKVRSYPHHKLIEQEWSVYQHTWILSRAHYKQASPLIGIAAVNSLLFTAYGASRRLVSPYPDLTVPQVALAGSMAGAANAVLASPVRPLNLSTSSRLMR